MKGPFQPILPRFTCHAEDERLRLRAQYEARIKALDGKVKAVSAKERRLVELEAMKRKAGASEPGAIARRREC